MGMYLTSQLNKMIWEIIWRIAFTKLFQQLRCLPYITISIINSRTSKPKPFTSSFFFFLPSLPCISKIPYGITHWLHGLSAGLLGLHPSCTFQWLQILLLIPPPPPNSFSHLWFVMLHLLCDTPFLFSVLAKAILPMQSIGVPLSWLPTLLFSLLHY